MECVYFKLSLDFVAVVLEGGGPLHGLVLSLQSALTLPQDLLVGLLKGLHNTTQQHNTTQHKQHNTTQHNTVLYTLSTESSATDTQCHTSTASYPSLYHIIIT